MLVKTKLLSEEGKGRSGGGEEGKHPEFIPLRHN